MKIALFVHDCFLEIGHSHAMIEILRNIPKNEIERIDIVSFTSASPKELFPELPGKVFIRKVPFPNLYPFIIKMIFYHIWTFFFTLFALDKKTKKVGIGIASLTAKIINIQFVHTQWDERFFQHKKMNFFTYSYKKVLFLYFKICEYYLYRGDEIKLGVLSRFVSEYCVKNFKLKQNQVQTIYSGVNLEKYKIDQTPRAELLNSLKENYPELSVIDPKKPIFLFVGAYERKGLPIVLERLQKISGSQIIVVGSPDTTGEFTFPTNIVVAAVKFTKELPKFYSLADTFVFPTAYEPFGLVITEAVAMGMIVYVTEQNVGATELLHGLEEVHICNEPKDLELSQTRVVSLDEKILIREKRIEKLNSYSWEKAGAEFYKLMR
jgi:glycosyltransferase involved in cell wall biosynthesis